MNKNTSKRSIRTDNMEEYSTRYYLKKSWCVFSRGCCSMKDSLVRKSIMAVVLALTIIGWTCREEIMPQTIISEEAMKVSAGILMAIIIVTAILLFGTILRGANSEHQFFRAGLVNALQEPPILCRYKSERGNPCEMYIYDANGIPLEKWQEKIGAMEAVLKRDIISIENYKDKSTIIVKAVKKGKALPTDLKWDDSLTPDEDFVLLLGESILSPITINLNRIPHMLIGGATGSGKTVLLKTLLKQCITKGASVVLADFKGGLDFSEFKETALLVTERPAFAEILREIIEILDERKELFLAAEASDIREYNKKAEEPQERIIVACDELAEVTDKTGETKAGKEEIDAIIGHLSTIARMGRAYGIHLVLGMQRADANVVPGQIRNNVGYRICGYSPDKVLADITLDNSEAVERLRLNVDGSIPGRFVDNSGNLFHGYRI